MPGVTEGENSIVGAFSFVNEDIPANVVAAGIPRGSLNTFNPQISIN
jgi:acetyltransferase-like isoleucine patch superfamily enzyme